MRTLHDTLDPFLGPGLLSYRYAMQSDEHGFEIRCRLESGEHDGHRAPHAAPRRIATTLTSRFGIQRIEAVLGNDVRLTAELIDPALTTPKSESAPLREEQPEPSEVFTA